MARIDGSVTIENAKIIFNNFRGLEAKFNPPGNRNFSVVLSPEDAEMLLRDGWNVKPGKRDDEGNEYPPHMKVTLKYRSREGRELKPPRVIMISSRGRQPLGEDEIEVLDFVDILKVDLVIRPYVWDKEEGSISAYLKTMYVTIEEDELDRKYADIPDAKKPISNVDYDEEEL